MKKNSGQSTKNSVQKHYQNNGTQAVASYTPQFSVAPKNVHTEMHKHMLTDGFDFVLDLQNSAGARIVDAKSGKSFLDFFTCFASIPVGMNHPAISTPEFVEYLGKTAINKPSNSDVYTEELATFVKTFFKLAIPSHFTYSFFIEGGSLAIENALKTAFDWKVRKNFKKGYTRERGYKVMHFRRAFHGRSGYTLSLTNTDPAKTMYFPKFQDWPRIHNPAIHFPLHSESLAAVHQQEEQALVEMKQAFMEHRDEIAAIIIEPIQGEGGDNHFRPEFLQTLRILADENEALLIFDEVQTGVGITGTMWAHQQLGVEPDIMAFGKKMQVCGIVAGKRIDEVDDNVFHVASRINSTWGGNLVDMVRATKYLEIIHKEKLVANARQVGSYLLKKLQNLSQSYPHFVSNPRGRGLFCAFDLPTQDQRNIFRKRCYDAGLLILASGEISMRFRPPLNLTKDQVDEGVSILEKVLQHVI